MTLPAEKRKPSENLYDYTTLLYGPTKIGKSSLLAQIPNILFLNSGGGLEAISCYEETIDSWGKFLLVGLELVTTEHKFEAIAFDTIWSLHKLCVSHMMKKLNIVHPTDLEWGKGYDAIKEEFLRPIMKLVLSKMGVFFIAHSKEVEIVTRTAKITKRVPNMQNYAYEIISPICGIIMFYDSEEIAGQYEKRVLRTNASEKWIAGDRSNKLARYGDITMDAPPANNWEKLQNIFSGQIKKED